MSPKPRRLPPGQSDLRSPCHGVPPCRGVPRGERNTEKSSTKAVPEVGINSDSPKGSKSSGFAGELSLCPPHKAQFSGGTPGCGEHQGENAAKSQEATRKEQRRRGEGPSPQTQQQTRIKTGELSITPQNEEGAAAKKHQTSATRVAARDSQYREKPPGLPGDGERPERDEELGKSLLERQFFKMRVPVMLRGVMEEPGEERRRSLASLSQDFAAKVVNSARQVCPHGAGDPPLLLGAPEPGKKRQPSPLGGVLGGHECPYREGGSRWVGGGMWLPRTSHGPPRGVPKSIEVFPTLLLPLVVDDDSDDDGENDGDEGEEDD